MDWKDKMESKMKYITDEEKSLIMGLRKPMREKMEKYINLTNQIKEWEIYDEPELELIVKGFEKFPREEVSKLYKLYLTDEIAEKLLRIGTKYENNTSLICNIISASGNMINRYQVKPTDKLYAFVRQFINQPKIDYFVAIHIDAFPQFKISEDKWDYIMSILDIKPKTKSFGIFRSKIWRSLSEKETIPGEYKNKIIAIIQSKIEEAKTKQNEAATKNYSQYIELLCGKNE